MRLRALRNQLFWGNTTVERRFGVALVLLAVALGVFLRMTGSEWRDAIPNRIEAVEGFWEKDGREFESAEEREKALYKSLRLVHFICSGLYWAALVNLALVGVLFFTRRWWCGRDVKASGSRKGVPGRSFWLWVTAAVVLAGGLRWARMDHSLYNDEVYNFRQYIHGKIKTDSDGSSAFKRAGWDETFWENYANNGVLFSVVARLFDEAWRPGDGTTDGRINERALRWPSLIAGLLSVGAVALLGYQLFGAGAGVAAAVLLAFHPWHLRYSTEARAYAMVILFAALAMLCLVMALRGNRWRWWLGFAGCQFLYMYAFAGALYFAIGINIAALVAIWARGAEWRGAALGRLVVASLFSAMLYLQLMAPCLPQMANTMAELESLRGGLGIERAANILSFLSFGMPLTDHDPTNATNPALAKFWPGGWWMLVPGLFAFAVLLFFAVLVFKRPGLPRVLLLGNALALLCAFGASVISGAVLHYWYVIYVLPFVVLFLAAGWTVIWKTRRLRKLAYVLPVLLALLLWRPILDYRSHGKEGLREAVAAAREGGAMIAGFWTDASAYALDMKIVREPEDLIRFADEAKAAGRDLSVVFGHQRLAMETMRESVKLAEGQGGLEFEKIAEFPGLEEQQFTTFVYRLRFGK